MKKLSITSRICLGCMSFGTSQWRPWVLDEKDSIPLLELAVELGIRCFDTANVYSGGVSEKILGKFISDQGIRDESFIATKLFYDTPDRLGITGLGRDNILGSTEASLERLRIDSIDLLQIHRWDDETPIEESLEAFAELIEQGKVKAIGASNLRAWQLAKAQIAAAKIGLAGFSAVQPHYNMLYREDDRELMPLCRDQEIHLLPWSPLARGRLARPLDQSSLRASNDDVADTLYGENGRDTIIALNNVAQDMNEAPGTVALAWLIHKGMTPIFGATKASHIEQAARAQNITLDDETFRRLEHAYTPTPPVELPYTAKNQTPTSELGSS